MSLIYWNRNSLKDIALICLENAQDNITLKSDGDLTIIKSNGRLVGFNILNASNKMKLKEGGHTISQEQFNYFNTELKLNLSADSVKSNFIVGKIIERKNHPKSKKLFVLKVNIGKDVQIVTNSLNSIVGKKVVVALPGETLLNGLEIKENKVMGIKSEGMLCGGQTLGLENTEGVYLVEDKNYGETFVV